MANAPSPANAYLAHLPQTRLPSLDFIYRLECSMSSDVQVVGKQSASSSSRIILPIAGGAVSGPRLSATILSVSGADWATSLPGESFMKLDARYTLKTDDGHFIYVKSKGIYHPESASQEPPTNVNQDQADWFTRLQFEANEGPYGWMNYVFGIGVLTMHEGKIVIDAYRLTNFPGREIRLPA